MALCSGSQNVSQIVFFVVYKKVLWLRKITLLMTQTASTASIDCVNNYRKMEQHVNHFALTEYKNE